MRVDLYKEVEIDAGKDGSGIRIRFSSKSAPMPGEIGVRVLNSDIILIFHRVTKEVSFLDPIYELRTARLVGENEADRIDFGLPKMYIANPVPCSLFLANPAPDGLQA
ncbi:hypothetical protein [Acetobacter persici]|uniref:Uncharacterized protein n=1 Tax=Acetobacter persici TaxID=1076596 RepID=A0A6V8IBY7_9PROT|nr:hypothetical protein [Acetobacter persici]OUI91388.1 hypothetical protein HK19_06175 [Acetobacter persici]GFE94754.1 hypothetical protein DmAi_28130 [Acetobacter persici]